MSKQDPWVQPQDIDDVTPAFPANVSHLMPPRDECEQGLRAMPDRGKSWIAFQQRWFFHGLSGETEVDPADGVDPVRALRHLGAIQGSFEPKHEHKEVAVAYLASRWFKVPPAAPASTATRWSRWRAARIAGRAAGGSTASPTRLR